MKQGIKVEIARVKFETITPIWTGDAWRENSEIKPSSIMGSLRASFGAYCKEKNIPLPKLDNNGKVNEKFDYEHYRKNNEYCSRLGPLCLTLKAISEVVRPAVWPFLFEYFVQLDSQPSMPVDVKRDVAFLTIYLFEFYLLFYWFSRIEIHSFHWFPVSRFT